MFAVNPLICGFVKPYVLSQSKLGVDICCDHVVEMETMHACHCLVHCQTKKQNYVDLVYVHY